MDEGTVLTSDDQPTVGSPEHIAMTARRDAYMSLVGGFLWLSGMTMWHLAYASGELARFLTNPGPSHFRAAVRVLTYLRDGGGRPLVFAGTRKSMRSSLRRERPDTFLQSRAPPAKTP